MAIESDVATHLHPDIANHPNIGLTLQGAGRNVHGVRRMGQKWRDHSARLQSFKDAHSLLRARL
jgi:hypothetical protein